MSDPDTLGRRHTMTTNNTNTIAAPNTNTTAVATIEIPSKPVLKNMGKNQLTALYISFTGIEPLPGKKDLLVRRLDNLRGTTPATPKPAPVPVPVVIEETVVEVVVEEEENVVSLTEMTPAVVDTPAPVVTPEVVEEAPVSDEVAVTVDPREVKYNELVLTGALDDMGSYGAWRKSINKITDVDTLKAIVSDITGTTPKANNHYYLKKIINGAMGGTPKGGNKSKTTTTPRVKAAPTKMISVNVRAASLGTLTNLSDNRMDYIRNALAFYIEQNEDMCEDDVMALVNDLTSF